MPNKYSAKKGWDVPKQKYKVINWSEYNESLRQRGDITVWLSDEVHRAKKQSQAEIIFFITFSTRKGDIMYIKIHFMIILLLNQSTW